MKAGPALQSATMRQLRWVLLEQAKPKLQQLTDAGERAPLAGKGPQWPLVAYGEAMQRSGNQGTPVPHEGKAFPLPNKRPPFRFQKLNLCCTIAFCLRTEPDMKKTLFVLAALPCFCFALQQPKEPSLRIETLHPDGTKTVRQMVTGSQVKTERLLPKNVAPPSDSAQRISAERLLASQLAEEAEARRAPSSFFSEKQRYLANIVMKLQKNWLVDDTMRGKECKLNIKLARDGTVTSTTPLGGDYNLCMSAVRAVENSGNFSMPKDPDVYDALKDLTMTLRPELR